MSRALRAFLLSTALVLSVFIFRTQVFTKTPSLIITELGVHEPYGQEWIEVYNTSKEPIDLSQWSIMHGEVQSGISLAKGRATLEPGAYAIIAQHADTFTKVYPEISSALFEATWKTLGDSDIALFFEEEIVETVNSTEWKSGTSIERVDFYKNGSVSENWKPHPMSHSMGTANTASEKPTRPTSPHECVVLEEETERVEEDEEENSVAPVPETTEPDAATSTSIVVGMLRIHEVIVNPSEGPEWVEIISLADRELSLEGIMIYDGLGKVAVFSWTIAPGGYAVVDLVSHKLNNSGDKVVLVSPDITVLDEMVYGDWDEGNWADHAPVPKKGESLIRVPGQSYTGHSASDFVVTTLVTKGGPNAVSVVPDPPVSATTTPSTPTATSTSATGSGGGSPAPSSSGSVLGVQVASHMVITELLPNPIGDDSLTEFIELYNPSSQPLSLLGWSLYDDAKKTYVFGDVVIAAESYIALYRPITGMTLNNTTDSITLVHPNKEIVQVVTYTNASKEGLAYVLIGGVWQWTDTPTPFAPNSGSTVETTTSVEENVPPVSLPPSTPPPPVLAPSFDSQVTKIEITMVYPYPDTAAGEEEYIELFNPTDVAITIGGLLLDDEEGGSKPYSIPDGTVLDPKEYLMFYGSETKIALNNTTDRARLLFPDGTSIHEVVYTNAKKAKGYRKSFDGTWVWADEFGVGGYEEETGTNISEQSQERVEPAGDSEVAQKNGYTSMQFADIIDVAAGTKIATTGIVSVLPGMLGTQYFYIAPIGSPEGVYTNLQIYQHQKQFPTLALGDKVTVYGEKTGAAGVQRLKITSAADVTVVSSAHDVPVEVVSIEALQDQHIQSLVRISGVVTEKKSGHIVIDDETGELMVLVSKELLVVDELLALGNMVTVTGFFQQTSKGATLTVRSADDVQSAKTESAAEESETGGASTLSAGDPGSGISERAFDPSGSVSDSRMILFFSVLAGVTGAGFFVYRYRETLRALFRPKEEVLESSSILYEPPKK